MERRGSEELKRKPDKLEFVGLCPNPIASALRRPVLGDHRSESPRTGVTFPVISLAVSGVFEVKKHDLKNCVEALELRLFAL